MDLLLLPAKHLGTVSSTALRQSQLDFTIPHDYMLNYLLAMYSFHQETKCSFDDAMRWLMDEIQTEVAEIHPASISDPSSGVQLRSLYEALAAHRNEICTDLQPLDPVFERSDFLYAEVRNEAKGALVIAIYRNA